MFCRKCGYHLPEGAVFCPKCGNRADGRKEWEENASVHQCPDNLDLEANAEFNNASDSEEPTRKGKKAGRAVALIGIALVLAVTALVLVFMAYKMDLGTNMGLRWRGSLTAGENWENQQNAIGVTEETARENEKDESSGAPGEETPSEETADCLEATETDERQAASETEPEVSLPEQLSGNWKQVYESSISEILSLYFDTNQNVEYISSREHYYGTYSLNEDGTVSMTFIQGEIYDNSVGEWKETQANLTCEADFTSDVMDCTFYGDGYVWNTELLKTDISDSPIIVENMELPNRRLNMYLSIFVANNLNHYDSEEMDGWRLLLFCYNYYRNVMNGAVMPTSRGECVEEEKITEITEKFFGILPPKENLKEENATGFSSSILYEDGKYYFNFGEAGDIGLPMALVNHIEKLDNEMYHVTFDTIYVYPEDLITGEPNYYLSPVSGNHVTENENIYYVYDKKRAEQDKFVEITGEGEATLRQTEMGLFVLEYSVSDYRLSNG